jgi:hypothetical protein
MDCFTGFGADHRGALAGGAEGDRSSIDAAQPAKAAEEQSFFRRRRVVSDGPEKKRFGGDVLRPRVTPDLASWPVKMTALERRQTG